MSFIYRYPENVFFLFMKLFFQDIIKELVLTTGGEDDMTQILQTLQSSPSNAIQLKIDILEALRLCLKESHRTRTVFRKVKKNQK